MKWGIIGPGKIAEKFAIALASTENSVLHAVASRDLLKAQRFSSKFNVPESYGSYEDLLDSKDIDVVYIATPHNLHFENAKACLAAGKHVLCEKPFTVRADEAEELFRLAKEHNLFIMEALWTRFLPVFRHVFEWLEGGEIGTPSFLDSSFGFVSCEDYHARLFNPGLAGGALLDIGTYNIDISQWILKKNPVEIYADAFLGQSGVDERTSVIMKYSDGEASQFTCSLRCNLPNDFTIYGKKGSIRIFPCFNSATRAALTLAKRETVVFEGFRKNGFEYQIEEVAKCITEGRIESSVMPHYDTVANMRAVDKIRSEIGLRFPFEKD